MKKFLTVLLVIAVMFTFSFSSAFAAFSWDANAGMGVTAAKAQALDYVKAFDISNLSEASQAKALVAKNTAVAALNQAATVAQVSSAVAAFSTTVDGLKSTLEESKAAAKAQLAEYVALLATKQVAVQPAGVVSTAKLEAGIDAAKTTDGVEAALNEALVAVSKAYFNGTEEKDILTSLVDALKTLTAGIKDNKVAAQVAAAIEKLTKVGDVSDPTYVKLQVANVIRELAGGIYDVCDILADYTPEVKAQYEALVEQAVADITGAKTLRNVVDNVYKYVGTFLAEDDCFLYVDMENEEFVIYEPAVGAFAQLLGQTVAASTQVAAVKEALAQIGEFNYKDFDSKEDMQEAAKYIKQLEKFVAGTGDAPEVVSLAFNNTTLVGKALYAYAVKKLVANYNDLKADVVSTAKLDPTEVYKPGDYDTTERALIEAYWAAYNLAYAACKTDTEVVSLNTEYTALFEAVKTSTEKALAKQTAAFDKAVDKVVADFASNAAKYRYSGIAEEWDKYDYYYDNEAVIAEIAKLAKAAYAKARKADPAVDSVLAVDEDAASLPKYVENVEKLVLIDAISYDLYDFIADLSQYADNVGSGKEYSQDSMKKIVSKLGLTISTGDYGDVSTDPSYPAYNKTLSTLANENAVKIFTALRSAKDISDRWDKCLDNDSSFRQLLADYNYYKGQLPTTPAYVFEYEVLVDNANTAMAALQAATVEDTEAYKALYNKAVTEVKKVTDAYTYGYYFVESTKETLTTGTAWGTTQQGKLTKYDTTALEAITVEYEYAKYVKANASTASAAVTVADELYTNLYDQFANNPLVLAHITADDVVAIAQINAEVLKNAAAALAAKDQAAYNKAYTDGYAKLAAIPYTGNALEAEIKGLALNTFVKCAQSYFAAYENEVFTTSATTVKAAVIDVVNYYLNKKVDLTNVKVTTKKIAGKGIQVTCDAIPGATTYKFWRATSKNGSYKLMFTKTTAEYKEPWTYTNTLVTKGTKYFYKVTAVVDGVETEMTPHTGVRTW